MCIVAVFSNNKEKIRRLCTTVVTFSNVLPHVQYLSDDTYTIITRTFAINEYAERLIFLYLTGSLESERVVKRLLTELLLKEFMNMVPRINS